MEITTKKLHHHIAPIIIVTVGILVITIGAASLQDRVITKGSILAHGLFNRSINVTRTTNGLTHVSLNKPKPISPEVSQAGRTTELVLNLHDR